MNLNSNQLVEFLTLAKFIVVGGVVAVIHITLAIILFEVFSFDPIISNILAFLVAFIFSFVGQYYWTFRSSVDKKVALVSYFIVSSLGFLANNMVLLYLLGLNLMSPDLSIFFSACIIPLVTFTLSRLWIFK